MQWQPEVVNDIFSNALRSRFWNPCPTDFKVSDRTSHCPRVSAYVVLALNYAVLADSDGTEFMDSVGESARAELRHLIEKSLDNR